MEIIVSGTGERSFKPNKINLFFNFEYKFKDYETAISEGVKYVDSYIKLLTGEGIKAEQVKTRSFKVYENKVYDNITRKTTSEGYVFKQEASLDLAFDKKLLANIMEKTSKAANPPMYRINFGLKNIKMAQDNLLKLAYEDAKKQAEAIAKASNKNLVDCLKTSFEPFDKMFTSQTNFYSKDLECCCKRVGNVSETIENIFQPEDITVTKTIYCLFLAN